MYLVHYPVVAWPQFALPTVVLSPIAKGAIVFVGAVVLSWGAVVALRRIPVIARVSRSARPRRSNPWNI